MKNCEQTQGVSVLQHGESVHQYLEDIVNHLKFGKPLKFEWRLPEWLLENQELFISSLPDEHTRYLYTTFHDCGKPYCLTIDEEGRRHFPNHAQVSRDIFSQVFPDNPVAADLIKHDMDIHLLKAEGIAEFAKNPHALTLLLTGLAEIHSNSTMFGGMESTSFKIKWKAISSRGKQILKIINSYENK
jgi:hypothetical protein